MNICYGDVDNFPEKKYKLLVIPVTCDGIATTMKVKIVKNYFGNTYGYQNPTPTIKKWFVVDERDEALHGASHAFKTKKAAVKAVKNGKFLCL